MPRFLSASLTVRPFRDRLRFCWVQVNIAEAYKQLHDLLDNQYDEAARASIALRSMAALQEQLAAL